MASRDGQLLVRARQALEGVWDRCREEGFVGRCYSRGPGCRSPFLGSNITLCDGKTIVVIHQKDGKGPIEITSFEKSRTPGNLAQTIRAILNKHNLL